MTEYPKSILSIEEQLQAYKTAEMTVPSDEEALTALRTIGYYRLRGYCYWNYDNKTKQYKDGTNFSDILKLYEFDRKLSNLLFEMISRIEVALRARLSEALLVYGEPLVWQDPAFFANKKHFWENTGSISREIARSGDVFIKHNFKKHDGLIPVWAVVETMSLGTLSKTVKNLKTGEEYPAYATLATYYRYTSPKGKLVAPSRDALSSWIQVISTLRNICAHNGRIYDRIIVTKPKILKMDETDATRYAKLFQCVLAMKYLRPTDDAWNDFTRRLKDLFAEYADCVELERMNFPDDWERYLTVSASGDGVS